MPTSDPLCVTCGGSRIKPWSLQTKSERIAWIRRTTAFPCPDCTEDTPDTPTEVSSHGESRHEMKHQAPHQGVCVVCGEFSDGHERCPDCTEDTP